MTTETENKPVSTAKKPLTREELREVWRNDEFHGVGGSYECDPFTGKRTPKKEG